LAVKNRNIKPDVYGISIADERQLIQGITLAATVKDASPNTLVVVGGNFWSRVTSAFKHPLFAKVFDSCDAIVYREGFQPIETLVETLDPTQASSTIWRDKKGNVVINPKAKQPTSFDSLPAPSLPAPVRVLGNILAWLTSPVKPSILPCPALKADISFVNKQDISLFYNKQTPYEILNA